ncbi:hypothetical protein J2Z84_000907 [Agrobacterium rubi]|nr:hypothetical protein [Agrobacterium rubi]
MSVIASDLLHERVPHTVDCAADIAGRHMLVCRLKSCSEICCFRVSTELCTHTRLLTFPRLWIDLWLNQLKGYNFFDKPINKTEIVAVGSR